MSNEPIVPPIDEMMEVDTAMGRLPLWKAKALMVGRIQHVLNDAVQASTAPADERPPPPAADASFTGVGFGVSPATVNLKKKDAVAPDPAEASERAELMAQLMFKINAEIERLEQRVAAVEASRAADARSSEALALAESLAESNPTAPAAMLEPLGKKVPDERRYH
jgi:hypothetical protein